MHYAFIVCSRSSLHVSRFPSSFFISQMIQSKNILTKTTPLQFEISCVLDNAALIKSHSCSFSQLLQQCLYSSVVWDNPFFFYNESLSLQVYSHYTSYHQVYPQLASKTKGFDSVGFLILFYMFISFIRPPSLWFLVWDLFLSW